MLAHVVKHTTRKASRTTVRSERVQCSVFHSVNSHETRTPPRASGHTVYSGTEPKVENISLPAARVFRDVGDDGGVGVDEDEGPAEDSRTSF